MPRPHANQLHPMLAIIEDQLVLKADLRMLQSNVFQALLAGSGIFFPGGRILGLGLGHAFPRADERGSHVYPHAVSEGVIAMIVRVEHEADGLGGGRAKVAEDGAGAPGKVRVDHQHVIAEDHPAGVGDDIFGPVGGAIVDAGGDLVREIGLAGGVAQERAGHQDQEGGGEDESFHRYRNFIMVERSFFDEAKPFFTARFGPAGPPCAADLSARRRFLTSKANLRRLLAPQCRFSTARGTAISGRYLNARGQRGNASNVELCFSQGFKPPGKALHGFRRLLLGGRAAPCLKHTLAI